jgi:hypothetical protein
MSHFQLPSVKYVYSVDCKSTIGRYGTLLVMNSVRLSVMSGLASNPANREIASSSGASEHQDIFFPDFFSIFFLLHFLKKLGKI